MCRTRKLRIDSLEIRDDLGDDAYSVNVMFVAIMMLALAAVIFFVTRMRPCKGQKAKAKRRSKYMRSKFKNGTSASGHAPNGVNGKLKNGDYNSLPDSDMTAQVLLESETDDEELDDFEIEDQRLLRELEKL